MKKTPAAHFWILVSTVGISGISQGMLLPLIAIIFEHDGLSSSLNGVNATALYIGILLASPFMEAPLRRFGYKPIILAGGLSVAVALALFPVWKSFWFWFMLRFLIGVGDHMLHFGAQTWITASSPENRRGRNISLYGLFFGIGFAIGPLLTRLVEINEALPFIVSSILSVISWLFVWLLRNDSPEDDGASGSYLGTFSRFRQVLKIAWVSLLPPLGYGFLEASLNGNFPVLALRNGLDISAVSIILPAFALGGIIFQFPLGIMSDRFGRRNVLMGIMLSGFVCFIAAGLFHTSTTGLLICFFLAGMAVGTTFSLGISYMADLLPRNLLPAGNLMCGIFFSLGSVSGPFIGGLAIQFTEGATFFYMISVLLLAIFLALYLVKQPGAAAENQAAS
ncbi:MFS transporter [Bacillus sp. B-jedd]|uniref:MFS transporter n=1 Tax=Bacillus sp. B-jedd TaxID=1476857 RepID=UPI0005156CD4|nr:MFS transporter [Bacillus sp. B-jedd]CEG25652.1 major facilitator superfamily protein [Bacillus sp. B-jedd]